MNYQRRSAATRLGISVEEYSARLERGEKWCGECRDWHPRSEFGRDAKKPDGLRSACRASLRSNRPRPVREPAERFFEKVDRNHPSGCWIWLGAKDPGGYGRFMVGRRSEGTKRAILAHRFSYELVHGPCSAPCLMHTCDNPPCVNPDHLKPGTVAENNADMARKGRASRTGGTSGDDHPRAKLTAADVIEIRRSKTPVADLCARFGVTKHAIYSVRSGKSWRSLVG